jgi:NitT/TauT family transport system substrate-binding protein
LKNASLRSWRSQLAALVLGLLLAPVPAWAEGRLRIAEQFGITFLILNVAQDQQLIEKRGKAAGVDIQVEFVKLSGGASINDTLLSGSIDVGGAGLGPILTLWDRTFGRQDVRAVASLGNLPYRLVTIDPKVRTIADFTDQDRIALPSVSVSVQSRLLQMATAKQFGDGQFDRFDKLQVALPHPEAAAALIKGGSEINAHFSSAPFQEQELAGNPRAHAILSSYDVLGGPASATLLYATARFRSDNPKTYRALLDGLADAVRLIHDNPELAADIFIRTNRSGIDRALLLKIIRSADVEYKLTPQNTLPLAEFMYRIGALKHKPTTAKDYVFDDPQNAGAN